MTGAHMILGGKGGVGKSIVASLIAQYEDAKGNRPLCVDIDPAGGTLSGFRGLDVGRLSVMEGKSVNRRKFDDLVDFMAQRRGREMVVDCGASIFIPLVHYMAETKFTENLADIGRRLILHTVIVGGQALEPSLAGLIEIADEFPDQATLAVWLNPYFGHIERRGRGFEDLDEYTDRKDRVAAIIRMPKMSQLFRRDIEEMLRRKLTFAEIAMTPGFLVASKQRLAIIKRRFFELMFAGGL